MKIANITFVPRGNYGGILQAYALQQVLIELGHEPLLIEIDEYQYISYFKLLVELPKRLYTKYILKKRRHILNEKYHNKYIDNLRRYTGNFIQNNIKSEFYNRYEDIDLENFDAFIVGSDQVWRYIFNINNITQMYLSFIPPECNAIRLSYGASFGTNKWEYSNELTNLCTNLIKYFDAISVREIDGVKMCEKYLGRADAIVVLDPTLLLPKEHYLKICEKISPCKKKILLAYILDKNENIETILQNYTLKLGLELNLISADLDATLTVEQWIAMFRDATFVITDSFHGTIFSIIFNKQFISLENEKRGNSRLSSLMNLLNLTDNLFKPNITNINASNTINWNKLNNRIAELKHLSINFLISHLNNERNH